MMNAMNRIWTVAISMIATMSATVWAETNSSALANDNIKPTGHRAFRAGEDLKYTIKYGFIKGGEGHFFVQDTIVDGRNVEHITIAGITTGLADAIFEVRDTYETYMDRETQLPLMSYRKVHEGKYRYFDCTTYDNDNGSVSIHKQTRKGEKDTTELVNGKMRDIVSALYYARNNNFNSNMNIGDTISYDTYFSGKVYPMSVRYRGMELVKTKWGKVRCYKFSPVCEVSSSFKSKDDMNMWISADDNRLPIKLEFKMFVGSFTAELTSCSGLAHVATYGD